MITSETEAEKRFIAQLTAINASDIGARCEKYRELVVSLVAGEEWACTVVTQVVTNPFAADFSSVKISELSFDVSDLFPASTTRCSPIGLLLWQLRQAVIDVQDANKPANLLVVVVKACCSLLLRALASSPDAPLVEPTPHPRTLATAACTALGVLEAALDAASDILPPTEAAEAVASGVVPPSRALPASSLASIVAVTEAVVSAGTASGSSDIWAKTLRILGRLHVRSVYEAALPLLAARVASPTASTAQLAGATQLAFWAASDVRALLSCDLLDLTSAATCDVYTDLPMVIDSLIHPLLDSVALSASAPNHVRATLAAITLTARTLSAALMHLSGAIYDREYASCDDAAAAAAAAAAAVDAALPTSRLATATLVLCEALLRLAARAPDTLFASLLSVLAAIAPTRITGQNSSGVDLALIVTSTISRQIFEHSRLLPLWRGLWARAADSGVGTSFSWTAETSFAVTDVARLSPSLASAMGVFALAEQPTGDRAAAAIVAEQRRQLADALVAVNATIEAQNGQPDPSVTVSCLMSNLNLGLPPTFIPTNSTPASTPTPAAPTVAPAVLVRRLPGAAASLLYTSLHLERLRAAFSHPQALSLLEDLANTLDPAPAEARLLAAQLAPGVQPASDREAVLRTCIAVTDAVHAEWVSGVGAGAGARQLIGQTVSASRTFITYAASLLVYCAHRSPLLRAVAGRHLLALLAAAPGPVLQCTELWEFAVRLLALLTQRAGAGGRDHVTLDNDGLPMQRLPPAAPTATAPTAPVQALLTAPLPPLDVPDGPTTAGEAAHTFAETLQIASSVLALMWPLPFRARNVHLEFLLGIRRDPALAPWAQQVRAGLAPTFVPASVWNARDLIASSLGHRTAQMTETLVFALGAAHGAAAGADLARLPAIGLAKAAEASEAMRGAALAQTPPASEYRSDMRFAGALAFYLAHEQPEWHGRLTRAGSTRPSHSGSGDSSPLTLTRPLPPIPPTLPPSATSPADDLADATDAVVAGSGGTGTETVRLLAELGGATGTVALDTAALVYAAPALRALHLESVCNGLVRSAHTIDSVFQRELWGPSPPSAPASALPPASSSPSAPGVALDQRIGALFTGPLAVLCDYAAAALGGTDLLDHLWTGTETPLTGTLRTIVGTCTEIIPVICGDALTPGTSHPDAPPAPVETLANYVLLLLGIAHGINAAVDTVGVQCSQLIRSSVIHHTIEQDSHPFHTISHTLGSESPGRARPSARALAAATRAAAAVALQELAGQARALAYSAIGRWSARARLPTAPLATPSGAVAAGVAATAMLASILRDEPSSWTEPLLPPPVRSLVARPSPWYLSSPGTYVSSLSAAVLTRARDLAWVYTHQLAHSCLWAAGPNRQNIKGLDLTAGVTAGVTIPPLLSAVTEFPRGTSAPLPPPRPAAPPARPRSVEAHEADAAALATLLALPASVCLPRVRCALAIGGVASVASLGTASVLPPALQPSWAPRALAAALPLPAARSLSAVAVLLTPELAVVLPGLLAIHRPLAAAVSAHVGAGVLSHPDVFLPYPPAIRTLLDCPTTGAFFSNEPALVTPAAATPATAAVSRGHSRGASLIGGDGLGDTYVSNGSYTMTQSTPLDLTNFDVAEDRTLEFFRNFRPPTLHSVVEWLGPLFTSSRRLPLRIAAIVATEVAPLDQLLDCVLELTTVAVNVDASSLLADTLLQRAEGSPIFAIQLLMSLETIVVDPTPPRAAELHLRPAAAAAADLGARIRSSVGGPVARIFDAEMALLTSICGISEALIPVPRPARGAELVRRLNDLRESLGADAGAAVGSALDNGLCFVPVHENCTLADIDPASGITLSSAAKVPVMLQFRVRRYANAAEAEKILLRRANAELCMDKCTEEEAEPPAPAPAAAPAAAAPATCTDTCALAERVEPPVETLAVIFKAGDEVRSDLIALQLMRIVLNAFVDAGLPLFVLPYKVMCTQAGAGAIEVVQRARSRDQIGQAIDGGLAAHFRRVGGPVGSARRAAMHENFIRSLAAYSILTYLLQVKDRHNGNLMIRDDGCIVHIDFGFIFDISPGGDMKFEMAPFKFTKEMLDVIGGRGSEGFADFTRRCVLAFRVCRQFQHELTGITAVLSQCSSLNCFKPTAVQSLVNRLRLDLDDRELAAHVEKLVASSAEATSTVIYDRFQAWQNEITY